MNKRMNKADMTIPKLLVDIEGLCKILAVGQNQARRIAELAEARVLLPSAKTARYNVKKIMDYIEKNSY